MNQVLFRETDLAKGTVLELGWDKSMQPQGKPSSRNLTLPWLPTITLCLPDVTKETKGRKWARRVFHLGALHKRTLFITVNVYSSWCNRKTKICACGCWKAIYRFNERDIILVGDGGESRCRNETSCSPLAFVFRVTLPVLRNQKESEVRRSLERAGDKEA